MYCFTARPASSHAMRAPSKLVICLLLAMTFLVVLLRTCQLQGFGQHTKHKRSERKLLQAQGRKRAVNRARARAPNGPKTLPNTQTSPKDLKEGNNGNENGTLVPKFFDGHVSDEDGSFVPQFFDDHVSVLLSGRVTNITCDALPDYRPLIESRYPAHHIHIPKCSGSSLATIVKKYQRKKKDIKRGVVQQGGITGCVFLKTRNSIVKGWHYIKPPNAEIKNAFSGCDFISTHTPYGFPESFGANVKTQITIVREPLSHLVSNYDYILENPSIDGGQYLKKTPLSTYIADSAKVALAKRENWWNDPVRLPHGIAIGNRQTWFVCGAGCSIQQMTIKQALNRAVENLITKIHIVGVVEDENSLYHRLHALYNFLPVSPPHANTHHGKHHTLTPQDKSLLVELLHADIILHKMAGFVSRCSN
uniref:Uncharacterized protein n=1 Tax=Heterosigma akashiwo TaxID=2829 RepID=A0A6V3BNI0_HETAK|mmetsp:Transcript_1830/g.3604  ORF Transcript_1830/g.3604 Transcript_1830/m.3604 type:complete len:420 (-) Transcript_1830:250-1509(-)